MTTEIKVGLVALLAMAVLSYMTFKVGGFTFREKGYQIVATFPHVTGLDARAPVRMAGVEIGRVEKVELAEGGRGAKVTLRIRTGIAIHAGGFAAIRASGLLGDRFVAIEPGTKKEILKDGATIAAVAEAQNVDQLLRQVSNLVGKFQAVAEDIKSVTASFREVFGTGEGAKALQDIVTQVQALTRRMHEIIASNQDAIGQSVTHLEQFTRLLQEEGQKLFTRLNQITQKMERGEGTLGKLMTDPALYDKLSGALDQLQGSLKQFGALTEKIQRGEGTVGKLFTDETAYNNLNRTLEGLSTTLNKIQRLKTTVGFRNEYQPTHGENKGYFSLQFAPRDDKYYLMEVADDPRGEAERVSRITTTNGDKTTVTELETRRKLKFSALFGQQFSAGLFKAGLRIGLMENSFGIGSDLYLQNGRVRLAMDTWDFSSDDPFVPHPRLKVLAQYNPFPFLELAVGYDQILNPALDTPFVGAGIRFEDEDIKYLLGSLPGLKP